jgi:hypothetical protein
VEAKASPTMQREMDYWVHTIGGLNLGIKGNSLHTYGFHRAGFEVGPLDYSRRHDPGKPYDMEWCCAGDFGHDGDPKLRQLHADLLGRLMNGEHSMIDEFIGQPWPDRPKYYWARWNGIKTLQQYTGAGHYAGKGGWSHISQRRSTANIQPNLWIPKQQPSTVTEDENMTIIAVDEEGQHYFCQAGLAFPIVEGVGGKTVNDQIADIVYLASQGAYSLAKGTNAEWTHGGVVRLGFYEGPAFGIIVHKTDDSGDGGSGGTGGLTVSDVVSIADKRIAAATLKPASN